ncbi:hypothetical protein GCM10027347_18330 [Larkinella harenae]
MGILVLSVLAWSCQDKAGADFIYEASSSQVAVGAYGGFKTAFPNVQTVEWSNFEERIWEARFTQDSVDMAALITPTGVVLDQGVLVDRATMPEKTEDYISKQYAGYRVHSVLTGANGTDNSPYRVILVNPSASQALRLQFSADGQFLSATELYSINIRKDA